MDYNTMDVHCLTSQPSNRELVDSVEIKDDLRDEILFKFQSEEYRLIGAYISQLKEGIQTNIKNEIEANHVAGYDEIVDIAQQEQIINDCFDFEVDTLLNIKSGRSKQGMRSPVPGLTHGLMELKKQSLGFIKVVDHTNFETTGGDRPFSPIGPAEEDVPNFKEPTHTEGKNNATTTINNIDQSRDLNVFGTGESASLLQIKDDPYASNKNMVTSPKETKQSYRSRPEIYSNPSKYSINDNPLKALKTTERSKLSSHYRIPSSENVIGTPNARGQILMFQCSNENLEGMADKLRKSNIIISARRSYRRGASNILVAAESQSYGFENNTKFKKNSTRFTFPSIKNQNNENAPEDDGKDEQDHGTFQVGPMKILTQQQLSHQKLKFTKPPISQKPDQFKIRTNRQIQFQKENQQLMPKNSLANTLDMEYQKAETIKKKQFTNKVEPTPKKLKNGKQNFELKLIVENDQNLEINVTKHISNLFELFVDGHFELIENHNDNVRNSQNLAKQTLIDQLIRIYNDLKHVYLDLLYFESRIHKNLTLFYKTNSAWYVAFQDMLFFNFKIQQSQPDNQDASIIFEDFKTSMVDYVVEYYLQNIQQYCLFAVLSTNTKQKENFVAKDANWKNEIGCDCLEMDSHVTNQYTHNLSAPLQAFLKILSNLSNKIIKMETIQLFTNLLQQAFKQLCGKSFKMILDAIQDQQQICIIQAFEGMWKAFNEGTNCLKYQRYLVEELSIKY